MAKNFKILHDQVMARPGAAERAAQHRLETLAEIGLYQLRIDSQLSQIDLAERLDITQPSISKIEHAEDLRISTLRNYIEALGAKLRVEAEYPDGRRVPLVIGR